MCFKPCGNRAAACHLAVTAQETHQGKCIRLPSVAYFLDVLGSAAVQYELILLYLPTPPAGVDPSVCQPHGDSAQGGAESAA